jgi:hypothetical protein
VVFDAVWSALRLLVIVTAGDGLEGVVACEQTTLAVMLLVLVGAVTTSGIEVD